MGSTHEFTHHEARQIITKYGRLPSAPVNYGFTGDFRPPSPGEYYLSLDFTVVMATDVISCDSRLILVPSIKPVELTFQELGVLLDCMDESYRFTHPFSLVQVAKERGPLRKKLVDARYGPSPKPGAPPEPTPTQYKILIFQSYSVLEEEVNYLLKKGGVELVGGPAPLPNSGHSWYQAVVIVNQERKS